MYLINAHEVVLLIINTHHVFTLVRVDHLATCRSNIVDQGVANAVCEQIEVVVE